MARGGTRFPLVLFSPGLGGVRAQNTAWAEELAGHGYVVAALDHPYDSAAALRHRPGDLSAALSSYGDLSVHRPGQP